MDFIGHRQRTDRGLVDRSDQSDSKGTQASDRREFVRLDGAFQVAYGVCGGHGTEVPGFTRDMGIGGICFAVPKTNAVVGDHLTVEISVPGYENPLYFLGTVRRVERIKEHTEIGLQFDFLGKSENYKALLAELVREHGGE